MLALAALRGRTQLLSGPVAQAQRFYRHRGVVKLLCSECRYVIRRWNVPILAVDCNANPRHKQALTNPPRRARGIPEHNLPWLLGRQYPRHPAWRKDHTFLAYSPMKGMRWT
mmetsp:Transcript_67142/g.179060  ORF Transcript_67142/g.179060 Transcript_67142/m.179060 type:complete len:112 (-) Transcript_67142:105-440(-)